MGDFILIRPQDDPDAQRASGWADDLAQQLTGGGHLQTGNVDASTPPTAAKVLAELGKRADVVCYFGHGDEDNWLRKGSSIFDATTTANAAGKAIVSIACKTGRRLGPDAVIAGVISWLGFTIKIPILSNYKNVDPIGDALVRGLSVLANHGSMQNARDGISNEFDRLATDFDAGRFRQHPAAAIGYYAALALRDHVALNGRANHKPL